MQAHKKYEALNSVPWIILTIYNASFIIIIFENNAKWKIHILNKIWNMINYVSQRIFFRILLGYKFNLYHN